MPRSNVTLVDAVRLYKSNSSILSSFSNASKGERRLLRNIGTRIRDLGPKDWRDWSRNPSYTNFKVPLHIKCAEMCRASRRKYEKQIAREVRMLIDNQPNAMEQMRMTRFLSIYSLWPPLYNRREISYTHNNFLRILSEKDRDRVNYLLAHKIY